MVFEIILLGLTVSALLFIARAAGELSGILRAAKRRSELLKEANRSSRLHLNFPEIEQKNPGQIVRG